MLKTLHPLFAHCISATLTQFFRYCFIGGYFFILFNAAVNWLLT